MQVAVLGKRSYLMNEIENVTVRFLDHPKQLSDNDDIAFCLNYYKLIKPKYFNRPKHGVYVLHASDLPLGRGWAPVNWALINGLTELCVTSIEIDDGCDTGDYHMKTYFYLEDYDTIDSAYLKVERECIKHINSILKDIREKGKVNLNPQFGEASWYDRRRTEDSELDIKKTIEENWNLLRACHNEDYPAFFYIHGKKIMLRYEVLDE